MKILMLSSSLASGGAETHVTELATSLAAIGHEVTVATAGGELVGTLEKRAVRHLKLRLDTHSPARLIASCERLKRLLKREHFDVIHTHSRIAALVCKVAVGRKRIPVVSTVHAHFRTSPLLRRLSFWGRRSIAVSEDLSEYLTREYGVPRSKICVIENGIDTDRFAPRIKRTEGTPMRILFASRLDTDCSLGALLLVRLAERLCERSRGVIIEIAGGGKEQKRLAALAKKVNFKLGYECVRILGFCRDMPSTLAGADIFVGVSRAALEAMSAGVPTVLCGNEGFLGVLDASTVKEAAHTNFCCRGKDLPDSEMLFDALLTLLDMSEDEREQLGGYLRSYVIKSHSLSSMARRTEEFYRLAIGEDGSHVVLCGYYGAGNLGDDAMLSAAIMQLAKENAGRSICVISRNKKESKRYQNIKIVPRNSLFAVRRAIRSADRLVLGGGSILQDKSSLRSLIYYASLIKYAHKKGVRVELLSNGLGPLRRRTSRRIVSKALSRADRISMRDTEALTLAKELGAPEDRLFLEDDLTGSTLPCDEARTKGILHSLSLENKDFALVAIRKKDSRKTKKELKKHLCALEILGFTPLLAVMHKKEDLAIAKALAKKHGGIIYQPQNAEELCGVAKHAKYAVGTRFHLLYLSKKAGIPIYPLGDDPKMKGL